MMQYIDKSAIKAEIKRLYKNWEMGDFVYGKLISFLDTLEVKEIDLEKESELIANDIMMGVQANKYHRCVYNTTRNDFNHSHLMLAARKGIELGLKTALKGK